METLPVLRAGVLVLLAGPRPFLRKLLPRLLADLPVDAPVRVLDGGNSFVPYDVNRALARVSPDLHDRLDTILVARAFTCYQVLSLLSEAPADGMPTLVLEMSATFYDENVILRERKHLFSRSIDQLDRLNRLAEVAVTVSTRPGNQADEWLWELKQRAGRTWQFDKPPAPSQPRLL